MKYTTDFKLEVVSYVLSGASYLAAARYFGIASKSTVKTWVAAYRIHGSKAFQPNHKKWTPSQKRRVLNRMWTEGWSINHTSAFFNIPSPSTVWSWKTRYESYGIGGLKKQTRGRSQVKKTTQLNTDSKKATDMTLEEIQEELEYLRAENAVLKKQEALLREKAAQTKKKR